MDYSEELKEKLIIIAVNGLLIDFSYTLKFNNTIQMPIFSKKAMEI